MNCRECEFGCYSSRWEYTTSCPSFPLFWAENGSPSLAGPIQFPSRDFLRYESGIKNQLGVEDSEQDNPRSVDIYTSFTNISFTMAATAPESATTSANARPRQPIWLRCEKKPFEHRSALTPTTAKKLLDSNFDVYVEKDPQRIFDDSEFEAYVWRLLLRLRFVC